MDPAKSTVSIEVVHALRERQVVLSVQVAPGATVQEALALSGIERHFPELDLAASPVGIFGKRVKRDTVLKDGDRIEIYRPLIADPKARRMKRAREGI